MESVESSHKVATDAVLASYGKFCVTFELVVFRLRCVIELILRNSGLLNQGIIQVLLANQTAEPLRALLFPLISQIRSLTASEIAAINNVTGRFQSLTEKRNLVVHSTWSLMKFGQNDIDYSKLRGFKYVRKKGKDSINILSTDAVTLDGYTDEAEVLADCFLALAIAIGFGDPIDSGLKSNESGVYLPMFKQYWPES